ncbi:MAG: type II toxin-antitoxin system RelE/ParE family toxin [bacterium]|nr:type II toxin-antitoxin system RelE/ParE family toxin [bacterium]
MRLLARKYRHIRADIEPVIETLESGKIIGDRIPGASYPVFKVRIKNSDIQKGKSSGYRFIYFLKNPVTIILVAIYSKLEQSDISAGDVRRILRGCQ